MNSRWQRKPSRTRHADDWLMTYADMITLLLCFFAVCLAFSMPKQVIPPKALPPPPPVIQPAKQPDILKGDLPFQAIPEVALPAETDPEPVPDASLEGPPALVAATAADTPTAFMATTDLPQTPAPAASEPASLPEIVNNLKPQDEAKIEQKGDRITTMQISSETFFSSGAASLNPSGKKILQEVAVNLKSEAFKDYTITVEGHTDDQPIKTVQFPSNWELSTARAAAVVHFFLEQGIPAQRLRAAGYADTFPLAPNRDAKGNAIPANQAKNRRVVIKLERIEKSP